MQGPLHKVLPLIDARIAQNNYFAGSAFTAVDIMNVFSLTTMRLFHPVDPTPYPSIVAYIQRNGGRSGYQQAMAKSDPNLTPMLT